MDTTRDHDPKYFKSYSERQILDFFLAYVRSKIVFVCVLRHVGLPAPEGEPQDGWRRY